jgi:hypothetical protein
MARAFGVKPELIRWAVDRSGLPLDKLAETFPYLDAWRNGEKQPTLKQLEAFAKRTSREPGNLFIEYNRTVAMETPSSWGRDKPPRLKSKALFQEYQFGAANRSTKQNTLAIYMADGTRKDQDRPIVAIGSLDMNDIYFQDETVSRRHCAIVNYPDDAWVHDLESTVGTILDGERLCGRALLDGMHDIQVGRVRIRAASSSDKLV